MKTEDLTLAAIDGHRHLVVGEQIVKAVAYSVHRDGSVATAYRFVTALTMLGELDNSVRWPVIRTVVNRLEKDGANLCENGQPLSECSEIDPCEQCWQDQNIEAEVIDAAQPKENPA